MKFQFFLKVLIEPPFVLINGYIFTGIFYVSKIALAENKPQQRCNWTEMHREALLRDIFVKQE